jgi:ATP-dependent exoDNAse (exonuclease V) beta subunit
VDRDIPQEEDFLSQQATHLRPLIQRISNLEKRTEALDCLERCDMAGLVRLKIVNTGLSQLNGNTFRSAVKNSDADHAAVNAALMAWSDQRKLQALNHSAQLLWTLYKARTTAAHRRKIELGQGSFADAMKGVSRLACDEAFAGGRAMAWSGIRHLMLDEFQDTSRLQWMIFERLALELLAGESRDDVTTEPKPSVFIVGDKKQSIYRFREAAPEVLDLAKEALTPQGLVTQTMSDSFRSSSAILDYVNEVFADGRLIPHCPPHQPSSVVTKKSPERFQYGSITVYHVPEVPEAPEDPKEPDEPATKNVPPALKPRDLEALTVATHIKRCITGDIPIKVYDSSTNSWRLPRPCDFAVLYPTSQNASAIEDALRHQDIPSVRAETKGYFDRQEIQDLNALVTWLTWPADTVALCTVLRSPIIGLDDATLQQVISAGPERIWDQISHLAPEAYALLSRLKQEHLRETLPEIAALLIHDYQVDERYARAFGPIEGPLARANIRKWFELTRSASADDARSTHQWSIALDEAGAEDVTGNATTASDAVVMMTIHKSKGLEFPIVIVTDTAEDWHADDTGWIKDSRPGQEGLWYIGTSQEARPQGCRVMNELRQMSEDASRAEKSRLLYVALTRATQHLVITGAGGRHDDTAAQSFHGHLKSAALALSPARQSEVSPSTPETPAAILVERPCLLEPLPPSVLNADKDKDKETHQEVALRAKPTGAERSLPSTLGTSAVKILTPSAVLKKTSAQEDHNSKPEPEPEPKPEPQVSSPSIPDGLAGAYGTMVHKLIEILVQGATITDQALTQLLRKEAARPIAPDDETRLIAMARAEVRDLTGSTPWRHLMHQARRIHAELPMTALTREDSTEANLVQAKADIVIEYADDRVLIVDFKTTAVTAASAPAICRDKGYFEQVRAYVQLYQQATQRPKVDGAILFTRSQIIVGLASDPVS